MVPCGLRRGRNKNVGRPGPPLIRISTDAGQAQCSAPVFSSPGKTNEYAPVMELVDMRDLGAVTSVKKFAINQVKAGSSCFYKRGSNNAFRLGSLAV